MNEKKKQCRLENEDVLASSEPDFPEERPRKDYGREQIEQTEFACVAEIPVTRAISGANSSEWKDAMGSEVRLLIKSNTWKLVEQRIIG